ncbi:MAG: sulfurtransferase [Halieaceae bacterium]
MHDYSPLISAEELKNRLADVTVVDCRFSLLDPDAGQQAYTEGHIPGAHYLHLNRDLSGPLAEHGGRHPLPEPALFTARLAALGISRDTAVVAYDDSGFAFAARLWWMMRALGFTNVQLLDGGLAAWKKLSAALSTEEPDALVVEAHDAVEYAGCVNIDGLREAQAEGAVLIDSREEKRYLGIEEPIDPVAGHIPGAVNYPWQEVSDEQGKALPAAAQSARLAGLETDRELLVYCGSGVTACVNLLALQLAGRDDARLYAGSWSDWCSWLES